MGKGGRREEGGGFVGSLSRKKKSTHSNSTNLFLLQRRGKGIRAVVGVGKGKSAGKVFGRQLVCCLGQQAASIGSVSVRKGGRAGGEGVSCHTRLRGRKGDGEQRQRHKRGRK